MVHLDLNLLYGENLKRQPDQNENDLKLDLVRERALYQIQNELEEDRQHLHAYLLHRPSEHLVPVLRHVFKQLVERLQILLFQLKIRRDELQKRLLVS